MVKAHRVNEEINAREVLVIGAQGERLGAMPTREALRVAREQGLDLVEMAATASPPVCRLVDYGKFRYEQAKKRQEARKGQHETSVREVRFRPKIEAHDIEFKLRTVQKLLEGGDKVKVTVMFRGREITHPERGQALLERVAQALAGKANMEKAPNMEGRRMHIVLSPVPSRGSKESKEKKEP